MKFRGLIPHLLVLVVVLLMWRLTRVGANAFLFAAASPSEASNIPSGVASAANGDELLGETGDLLSSSDWMWTDPLPMAVGSTPSTVGLLVQHLGGSSPVDSVTVEFRLARPDGDLLGRSLTNVLRPNAIESTGPVTWEPDAPGEQVICAIIDPDNRVPESNEQNNTICHTLPVRDYLAEDRMPPVVDHFGIANGASTTNQMTVTLEVTATDATDPAIKGQASGVQTIKFVEFEYVYEARRWKPAQISEWMDYDSAQAHTWLLTPTYGMRYIQAWAADKAHNVSLRPGLAAINLLPLGEAGHVRQNGLAFYRVDLKEGDRFMAWLRPHSGDPDLYLWGPNEQLWHSNAYSGTETVGFQAPTNGRYQIEVHGFSDAEYRLTFGAASAPRTALPKTDNPKPLPEAPAVPLDLSPSESSPLPPPPIYTLYLPLINNQ